MRKYIRVIPYPTEDNPKAHKLEFTVGVQTFLISDGVDAYFTDQEAAEWCATQLAYALETMKKEMAADADRI